MNPLALMNFGLAQVPTYRPPKEHAAPAAANARSRESDERRAELLEMIGSDGPMTKPQICDALRCCSKTADRYVASLMRQGLLAPCLIGRETYYWRPWRSAA